jgi:hypothetical protein
VPQLPSLSPQQANVKFNATNGFKSKAQERQMAAQERRMRAAVEAPRRHEFLNGLLNQDLQKISKWHGSRPHHEQKRFVRAVDSLYKGFSKMDGALPALQAKAEKEAKAAALQQAAALAEAQRIANQDDPYLRESPRGPPAALGQSASAPNLSKPIDVFEQNKRRGRRQNAGASGSDTASVASSQATKNGLEKWLDAMSTTTYTTQGSTATQETSLSQMTRTTASGMSDCSEPGTHNQMIYRWHKRAFAASKRRFDAKDQHAPAYLKDGVPNIGFPECERMATNYRDVFGHKPLGGGEIHQNAYKSVFNEDRLPYVEQFLDTAPKEQKDQVAGMVRSLNYLRLAHHRNTSCVMRQEMDLHENARLWRPKRQEQVFRPEQRNLSRVPLGALGVEGSGMQPQVKEETPRPSGPPSLYSPSVSGLGSLPLTPRSLPTPLVGGKDFSMISAPGPLAPIAEVR